MRSRHWADAAWVTESFVRQFQTELNPGLRQATQSKFEWMCKIYMNSVRKLAEHFDRVAYLGHEAYELDINRSWRAIVQIRDRGLVLCRVGDHNMILKKRFTLRDFARATKEAPLPFSRMVCESALQPYVEGPSRQLLTALDSRWLYSLSTQQSEAVEVLYQRVTSGSRGKTQFMVSGGPGTGKTVILIQVAELFDWDPSRVVFDVSDEVATYLAAGLGDRIRRCRAKAWERTEAQVVLVDDPTDWIDIELAFDEEPASCGRLVVVATDLAQVKDVVEDKQVRAFMKERNVGHINLTECYRQTEKVGRQSLAFLRNISERFTKHIHQDKVSEFARRHRMSIESANSMDFVSPGGYATVVEKAGNEDVLDHLRRISAQPLWRQWHPLCLVLDDDLSLNANIRARVKDLNGKVVRFSDVEALRGVEYQHVFLVLGRIRLLEVMVKGKSGLSTDDYLTARSMRIPFSRATDSMVVFGFEN